jgi:hypothetical protein
VRTKLSVVVLLLTAASVVAQVITPKLPTRPLTEGGPRQIMEPPVTMAPPGEPLARRTPTPLPAGNPQSRGTGDDGASVDTILAALYESVSHPDGVEPNWAKMRGIFLPVGMLIPPKRPNQDMFTVLDVDGFRDRTREFMATAKQKGETTAFFEKEVARKLDCFGNVCQAFSTYEARRAPTDEKPFVRGINSIQLLNDGQRWWVASVVWDTERPNNPIPAEYAAKPKP